MDTVDQDYFTPKRSHLETTPPSRWLLLFLFSLSPWPRGTVGSGCLVSVPGSWRTALTALGISRVIRQPFARSWVTRVWEALGSVRMRGGLQKGQAMAGGRELSAPSPISREWGRAGDWVNQQWPLLSSIMPSKETLEKTLTDRF